jgi:hypothetical protein
MTIFRRGYVQVQRGDDNRAVTVAELHGVEIDGTLGVLQRDGVLGRPYGGHLLQESRNLLKGGLGTLEGVVEHGHLVHGLEEPLGGEDECQQHADFQVPAQDTEAPEEQDHCHTDIADQHEARLEDAIEVDGAYGDAPVVLRELAVTVRVFALLAEGLDGTDAGHGFHEVHNQPGGYNAGFTEGDLGVLLVPACQEEHGHPGGQHQQAAPPVQGKHGDGGENHEQHA